MSKWVSLKSMYFLSKIQIDFLKTGVYPCKNYGTGKCLIQNWIYLFK